MQNENLQKALQCAQLLRQDLADLVSDKNPVVSALGLVLIKQVREVIETLQYAQGGEE